MKEAARNLEFELAAILRDEIGLLEKEMSKRIKEQGNKKAIKRPPRHGRTR